MGNLTLVFLGMTMGGIALCILKFVIPSLEKKRIEKEKSKLD